MQRVDDELQNRPQGAVRGCYDTHSRGRRRDRRSGFGRVNHDKHSVHGRAALRFVRHRCRMDSVLGQVPEEKVVYLKDILEGKKGRQSPDDITYSERGNLQGAQFYAVAGKVYELAKQKGLGKEIPTEWFLQDIRD